jgi:hypothetical protein
LGQGGGGDGRGISESESNVLDAFRMPPIIPVYDEFGGYAGTAAKGFNNPANPVARRDGLKNNSAFGAAGFGNIYAEVDLIEGMTFKTSVGGNYGNFYGYGFTRVSYENSENNSSFGYNEFSGTNFSWVFTNTLQYKKQLKLPIK